MNEMALELLTAPIILKRILQRVPSPLMPARVVSRVSTLNVPWVPGGIKPQNFRFITVPLISPAETLSTAITLGSYFISQEEPAKLLIWEILTETLKYLALFDAVVEAMDTVTLLIGVGVGVELTVGVGVGGGVTGPELLGQKTTAHTIAAIIIIMIAIT